MNAGLKVANEVKKERILLRESVAAGALSLSEIILDPPEILRVKRSASKPITVLDVLMWRRFQGRQRTQAFLNRLGINPHLTLFDLSSERRQKLADALGA